MPSGHILGSAIGRDAKNAILLYVLLTFLCIVEGFYLVYRVNVAIGGPAGMVVCFYIDKLLETLVVGTLLIHGQFHAQPQPGVRWFWILALGWCIIVVLSTVPVLSSMSASSVTLAVEYPALAVVYAGAAGFIFYSSIYFIFVNRMRTDIKDMVVRLVVFGIGLFAPFATSLFM